MMVGSEVLAVVRPPVEASAPHPALLEIRNLDRKPATPFSIPLKNINLDVRAGEVIGIAGVAGNGQGELFEAISGEVLQQEAGSVRIRNTDAGRLSISGRRLLGAAFVPEERLGHGAAPRMKLSENLRAVAPQDRPQGLPRRWRRRASRAPLRPPRSASSR